MGIPILTYTHWRTQCCSISPCSSLYFPIFWTHPHTVTVLYFIPMFSKAVVINLSRDFHPANDELCLLSISKFDERSAFLYVLHNAEDFQIYFCTEMHCRRSVPVLRVLLWRHSPHNVISVPIYACSVLYPGGICCTALCFSLCKHVEGQKGVLSLLQAFHIDTWKDRELLE